MFHVEQIEQCKIRGAKVIADSTKWREDKKSACSSGAPAACGVEGQSPSSRSAERETPIPKGAPHRVNWITVRWTDFQEGHALQERAAPSRSPAGSPLQVRRHLNEQT